MPGYDNSAISKLSKTEQHALLDRALERDTFIIPRLHIHTPSGETAQVRVGYVHFDDDSKAEVYMKPLYESIPAPISNGEHHRLQYFYYDDGCAQELDMDEFDYTDSAIDIMLFYSAGLWRWKTRERRIQHVKWMLFVWQHVTIQDLPTAEVTMGTKSAGVIESPSVDGERSNKRRKLTTGVGDNFEDAKLKPSDDGEDSENDPGFDFSFSAEEIKEVKLIGAKAKVKADMIKLGEDGFDLDFYMEPDGIELSEELIESIKDEISREKAEKELKEIEEDSDGDYELPTPEFAKNSKEETEAKEIGGSPISDYELPGPRLTEKSGGDLDGEFGPAFKKLESMKQEAAKIKTDMARDAEEESSDAELDLPPPRLGQIEKALKRFNEFKSI